MVNIKKVLLNEDATVTKRVNFPQGTKVTDRISGVKYTVGLSNEYLLEAASSIAEEVRAVQEGKLQLEKANDTLANKPLQKEATPQERIGDNADHSEDRLSEKGRSFWSLNVFAIGTSFFAISLITLILWHRRKWFATKG